MKVEVHYCRTQDPDVFQYRLVMPCGSREFVKGPYGFPRNVAKEALDICENLYGLKRRNVRWVYR